MARYEVTYTDPEAVYPAPKQTKILDATRSEIWGKAIELGLVNKIVDLDTVRCVYSIHWSFNYLGLTAAEIQKNLEF